MNLNQFENLYPVSKTLRFKLIPVGKTTETIQIEKILEEDEQRAKDYKKAKKLIDSYHVAFIEKTLSSARLDDVRDYIDLFMNKKKNEDEVNKLSELEISLRKQISELFVKDEIYKKMSKKEMITELMPAFLEKEEDKEIIAKFAKFTTAFTGFFENRENVYTSEAIPTAISYRLINDNLPKFINNLNCYEEIKDVLKDKIDILSNHLDPCTVGEFFTKDSYSLVLSQKGIDTYNSIIGGWKEESGEKIQGLNEFVNEYNQKLAKGDARLPKFQMLYKQILSEKEGMSFYMEGIESDGEMLDLLKSLLKENESVYEACKSLNGIIENLSNYDIQKIFIANNLTLTAVSNGTYGSWSTVKEVWKKEYQKQVPMGKSNPEKYDEKMDKAYKNIKSFSIAQLDEMGKKLEIAYEPDAVEKFFAKISNDTMELLNEKYKNIQVLIEKDSSEYEKNEEDIAIIKDFLDIVKVIEKIGLYLSGEGHESEKDEIFYGDYSLVIEQIRKVDKAYDLIRNYVTKKPYKTDKYKLYFSQSDFLSGWDTGGNGGKRSAILRKDSKVYLLISKSTTLPNLNIDDNLQDNYFEKIDYRLLPGPNKMLPKVIFSKAHIDEFCPSNDILRIKEKETFKKGANFNVEDCRKLIEFYQNCLTNYPEWSKKFNFKFSKPENYEDISRFYKEVETQGYALVPQRVSEEKINTLVEEGKVYLFQIYNKDFSEYSHGTKNLHTLFFNALFEQENQKFIKLNGNAEMFMRPASIAEKNRTIHKAGIPINSKNPDNAKRESTFDYDIVKDKRYTVNQFEFHVPIQINWTANSYVRLNDMIRKELKDSKREDIHIIGIDRGERNLLYICVIDGNGKIVEQFSLNQIITEHDGSEYHTDYHKLLDYKEDERKKARQNWTAIENIKELKEGYISQVVHKICQLVVKYSAVIAMEDLNSGFKRGRTKVEKQVYQKFEKALIEKLNYMCDKTLPIEKDGSIVKGYQLTEKFESFSRMRTQNGVIFYIPAWLTSKIDPVTGFADLLKPKYDSVIESKAFINNFDSIKYIASEDNFAFELDYNKFPRTNADFKKKWILYSNGERIATFRNPEKNGEWDQKSVNLTTEMKNLFDENEIKFSDGEDIRDQICSKSSKQFFESLISLIKLTLQMRNSLIGRTDVDYLISPVKDKNGVFYDSRDEIDGYPKDADANGAYNIARKVLWAIDQFKEVDDEKLTKISIAITNKAWLEYVQK